jgi:hypothetical protein
MGEQFVLRVHLGAVVTSYLSGAVGRVGVDHENLVYQRVLGQGLLVDGVYLIDDSADGIGHVAAWQDQAHRQVQLALAAGEFFDVAELLVAVRAFLEPLSGVCGRKTPLVSLHPSPFH